MRIGDLIEHEQDAVLVDIVQRDGGQGLGLEQHALMHRVGAKQPVEILGRHGLRLESALGEERAEPLRRILGGKHLHHFPPRIGERGFDGVQAEQRDPIGGFPAGVCLGLPRQLGFPGLFGL